MEAYFFYIEMAVVRFHYEVREGFALHCREVGSAFGDNRQGAEQVCKTSLGRFDSYWPHKQGDTTVVRFRSREDKKPKRVDGFARPWTTTSQFEVKIVVVKIGPLV